MGLHNDPINGSRSVALGARDGVGAARGAKQRNRPGPMSESLYQAPGVAERRAAAIPVGRIGAPEDMAEVVLFLASDRAGFVNGQEIIVDGGFEHMLMSLVPSQALTRKREGCHRLPQRFFLRDFRSADGRRPTPARCCVGQRARMRLGRPRTGAKVEAVIRARLARGDGIKKVAKALGVGNVPWLVLRWQCRADRHSMRWDEGPHGVDCRHFRLPWHCHWVVVRCPAGGL